MASDYSRTPGKPCPPLVHVPTDVLLRILPERASWCGMNFQHSSIYSNDAAKRDLAFEVTIRWVEGMCRSIRWLDDHGAIPACEGFPWHDRIIGSVALPPAASPAYLGRGELTGEGSVYHDAGETCPDVGGCVRARLLRRRSPTLSSGPDVC